MNSVISLPQPSTDRRDRDPLVISCEECVMRMTNHCHDCMVTFLCELEMGPTRELRLSGEEADAIALLVRAGLVPALRFSLAG
jgi:hypothetical protein